MATFAHKLSKLKDPPSWNRVLGGCRYGQWGKTGKCGAYAEYECEYRFYKSSRKHSFVHTMALCPEHARVIAERYEIELPRANSEKKEESAARETETPEPRWSVMKVAKARKKNREIRTPVRFTEEEHAMLAEAAKADDRKLSSLIRHLVFTHPWLVEFLKRSR